MSGHYKKNIEFHNTQRLSVLRVQLWISLKVNVLSKWEWNECLNENGIHELKSDKKSHLIRSFKIESTQQKQDFSNGFIQRMWQMTKIANKTCYNLFCQ